MVSCLLDTNHLSAAIRRVSPVRDRIRRTIRDGVRVGTTMPVLCELEAAIHQTNQRCLKPFPHPVMNTRPTIFLSDVSHEIGSFFDVVQSVIEMRGAALSIKFTLQPMARHEHSRSLPQCCKR